MTFFSLFLFGFLALVAAVSIFRIVHLPLSWRLRTVLAGLRCMALVLILVAFIEPFFTLERLPPDSSTVPVLVDASQSMRLFSPDSLVRPVLEAFDRWNRHEQAGDNRFAFYSFGDSLRPMKLGDPLQWSDRRSFFPETFTGEALQNAASLVLVTDGNWSNGTCLRAGIVDKNLYFLPFTSFREYPYLRIELKDFPSESIIDSPLIAMTVVEGFSDIGRVVTVSARSKKRTLAEKRITVPAGYFKRDIPLSLLRRNPGRVLYRFDASFSHDSLCSSAYAVHSTLASSYTYACYGARPSLDQRFIRLALQRQRNFREREQGGAVPLDLLVLFSWDDTAKKMAMALKPWGAALCIGCLPCSLRTVRLKGSVRFHRPFLPLLRNPFEEFNVSRLPPPERIVACVKPSLSKSSTVLSVLASHTIPQRMDTFDLVAIGHLKSHPFIACAACETWKFDFLQLAVAPDEERAFSFSGRLLGLAQEAVVSGLSRELLVYPVGRLSSLDSLRLYIVFPKSSTLEADFTVRCMFTGDAIESGYDTSFVLGYSGGAHETISLKPLDAGTYHVVVTARSGKTKLRYSDSVRVEKDRSEYMIKGQNLTLLRELAQPLGDTSIRTLQNRFFSRDAALGVPIKETFHMSRNWLLLILIFLVLGVEWILRRMLGLD